MMTQTLLKEMTLAQLRARNLATGSIAYSTPVRLLFRSLDGTKSGVYVTTAEYANFPNSSDRFFPDSDKGETAANLGWEMPYWYSQECYKVIILA